ncbi:MAG: molybdopterin-guanine dinucleotide biosynthesis protein MobB [Thermodesulfovibrio sp.]|nr:molybdopterin-guanine dinucleotide biosynthesis protein MobB [Thermodesulfovibrio sp.]
MIYPLIIGVGSAKSGSGKTTFIERFIRFIKRLNSKILIISIKYTKTSQFANIITNAALIQDSGKDTDRMKKAGADHVYWVRASEEKLATVAEKLRKEILSIFQATYDKKGIIVILEGNSLVRVMRPDVIIFINGRIGEQIKPSGKAILDIADVLIEDEYAMEKIMSEIEKIQQKKLIEKLLKERSNDGKITCSEARKIAEELKVPYIEVGKMANELKIKIRKCELGCF